MSQDIADPAVERTLRSEASEFPACVGVGVRPSGGPAKWCALAHLALRVYAHQPTYGCVQRAGHIQGTVGDLVTMRGYARPDVALLIPVLAGGAHQDGAQHDGHLAAEPGSRAVLVLKVGEQAAAVLVEEAVGYGHGAGPAEGVNLGFVDGCSPAADLPVGRQLVEVPPDAGLGSAPQAG